MTLVIPSLELKMGCFEFMDTERTRAELAEAIRKHALHLLREDFHSEEWYLHLNRMKRLILAWDNLN